MSSNKYLKMVKRLLRFVPDKTYIQIYYFSRFRRFCDFSNPTSYNEKLQWLKLHYRSSTDSILVDKFDVKREVSEKIGEKFLIPTLAVYDNADEIDFTGLPEAFVLKCTHDSEGIVIVRDKSQIDEKSIRKKLNHALRQNFFYIGREPHYRHIKPRIIAEPLLVDQKYGQLLDFKFFCFDGEVKAMFVASGRQSGDIKFDYFDPDYTPLDIRQNYSNSSDKPKKPARFDQMLDIARTLSRGHPHVRVDLYEVNGRIYFGELTFFHFSGFAPFVPEKWDRIWGDWLSLPESRNR